MQIKKKLILVVDDEEDIVELVAFNLEKEGMAVLKAFDGETALKLIRTEKPDLLILDLMMPGIPGLEVCRLVRQHQDTETLPILMLTAKGEALDKILGLEMGADDYVTKPFNVRELVARVRALLRRSEIREDVRKRNIFTDRGLQIDYDSYEVKIEGRKVDLGPTELKLLMFLARNPGRGYSRDQLLDKVWGDETFVEPRTVDVKISRLRAAIEKDKENPEYILTVRGIGYKFASDV
jgi:phosphate regulon transcriptional regulator PhoB